MGRTRRIEVDEDDGVTIVLGDGTTIEVMSYAARRADGEQLPPTPLQRDAAVRLGRWVVALSREEPQAVID